MSCTPSADTATKKSPRNKCACDYGAYVPRWKNVTQVWTQSDCTDPTTKAVATANGSTIPAARLDNTYDTNPGGAGSCSGGVKCGLCGGWLAAVDFNRLPAQEVTPGTDDILAGATPDATHYTVDNNSYQAYPNAAASFFQVGDIAQIVTLGTTDWTTMGASANTVGLIFTVTATGSGTGTAQLMTDMLMARRRGGMWIFAQKFWHGMFPWDDADTCAVLPTNIAGQTKYRTFKANNFVYHFELYSGNLPATSTPSLANPPVLVGTKRTIDATGSNSQTVNRFSGVINSDANVVCKYVEFDGTVTVTYNADTPSPLAADMASNLYCLEDVAWLADPSGYLAEFGLTPSRTSTGWTLSAHGTTGAGTYDCIIVVNRTATSYDFNIQAASYLEISDDGTTVQYETGITIYTGSFALSDTYDVSDLTDDFKAALNGWNMSDFARLNNLRTDENLAHSALCTWDERQTAVSPFGINFTINDYSSPATDSNGHAAWTYDPLLYVPNTSTPLPSNYAYWTPVSGQGVDWIPTWNQINWHDPQDCIWQTQVLPAHGIYFTDGNLPELIPSNFTYANLITGILTGGVISHTAPTTGITDRHFWMGAVNYRREGSPIMYNAYSHGAYSNEANYTDGTYFEGQLPTPTMRWMPPQNEKYDGAAAGTPPIGNFPQQFTDFSNGCLKGGKYCQAVQKWNAVDYLQPSGKRKFDIAQNTVGVITAAGSGYFTVGKPSTTSAFPATGYIAVTGSIGTTGIYPVTGAATDNGDGTWNVPVGSKIDDLPTGGITYSDLRDSSNWLGWLKWIGYTQYATSFASAPGITGRVAITTSYATGVLTVTTTAAQPYFRVDPASNALRAVNLYDVNGTLLNGSPLVLSRTDDSHFTVTTSNYSTAVWMVDAALTWAQSGFTSASQNTGVHVTWGFDQRQAALTTASQPAWLNGSGAGTGTGVVGCLDASYGITQFNYPAGSCPAIVGIVPDGSPEYFGMQVLFDFPTTPVDGSYGAHSQSFIGLTMEDPFEIACGSPFKPDFDPMDYTTPLSFSWKEDDGSGHNDDPTASPPVYYFSLRPIVEALASVPSGKSLPTGVTLFFDPSNKFAPPNYPNGIPFTKNVMSDWATAARMCGATRWTDIYATFNDTCP